MTSWHMQYTPKVRQVCVSCTRHRRTKNVQGPVSLTAFPSQFKFDGNIVSVCVSTLDVHWFKLECEMWYHHPRRQQCVLSRHLRIFKVAIDAVTISKIIVFEIICYIAYNSSAKFTFPIEKPSNKAAKCGIRRSWKLNVKPNLGCCSNITITISYISVFDSSW